MKSSVSLCKAWSEIIIIIIIIIIISFFLVISVGKNEEKEVRHFNKQNVHSRHVVFHFLTLAFLSICRGLITIHNVPSIYNGIKFMPVLYNNN
jgi:hypothetical protein